MIQRAATTLAQLYEADETAWLDAMADLIQQGQWADLDSPHLGEYLSDMALRDRREVKSRLVILMAHLLKWEFQPEKRSRKVQVTSYRTERQVVKERVPVCRCVQVPYQVTVCVPALQTGRRDVVRLLRLGSLIDAASTVTSVCG